MSAPPGSGGWRWLRRLVRPVDQAEEDLEAELDFHLEGRVRDLRERGLAPAEARREALRRFGSVERARAACRRIAGRRVRDRRRRERMAIVVQDVRYALRGMRKNPVFAAVGILTLALGIGAVTAVFSVVDAVVLRPLPFEDPEELVVVWERNPAQGIEAETPSPPNFADLRARSRTIEEMTAWADDALTLTGVERPEVLDAAVVQPNFFEVLGVEPTLGRGFRTEEGEVDGGSTVVIGHGLWQRRFGGAPDALGRVLVLDQVPREIVGVAPRAFRAPRPGIDVWLPGDFTSPEHHRTSRFLFVLGRLADGATLQGARAELEQVAAELAEEYPDSNAGWTVALVPARDQTVGNAREVLLVILGAVGLVLLIACANVANLLLGRTAYRDTEFAVRSALGASRGRLRAQLLTESFVLAFLGGALGVVLAYQGVRVLPALEPGAIPRIEEVGINLRVLLFALGASVLTAAIFGTVPALRAGRDQREALAGGGRGAVSGVHGAWTRKALVVAEVGVSVVLLAGAALLGRSFLELRSVDPGFRPEGVLTARINLDQVRYPGDDDRARYVEGLLQAVRRLPGVEGAGVTTTLPMDPGGIDFGLGVRAEGHPEVREAEAPEVDYRLASPGYFESMGIPLRRGRLFTESDRDGARRVALVNEAFVDRFWPGEDPIGKRFTVYYIQNAPYEVVGVVGDTRHSSLASAPAAQFFVPVAQAEYLFGYLSLVVRGRGGSLPPAERIREAAMSIDPDQPLFDLATVESIVAESMARDRFAVAVFGLFALIALTLSAAGIYGVISYRVARRTREIGLRMALGAEGTGVLALVVREALGLAGAGVAVGLAGSLVAARLLAGLLYGIAPSDPATHMGVGLFLLAVAGIAAFVPARRAAATDPARALRSG